MPMLSAAIVQASRSRPFAAQVSGEFSIPAPTGGWNKRDVLSAMAPNDAVVLENWIADINSIILRKGYLEWATGISGNYVETLMQYSPPSGSNILFAAGPTDIYDVTNDGAATLSKASLTNGRWSHVMFSNSTGTYLYVANGADSPMYFDGATWTNTGFTGAGLTVTNLNFVHSHLNRLWFIEKNTLNAWYGGTSSISGTLNKLILGPFCKLGGYLVAIGTWTRDGGAGSADDYLVFITSKGEVLIYAGMDPTAFGGTVQIGVFKIAEPIGNRCFKRLGSDLAVITSQGLISLVQTLPQTEGQRAASTITDKIIGAFRDAHMSYQNNFGWQVFEYPARSLLFVNVPLSERETQNQFVLNTRSGAWSKFKGVNAACWSLLGDIPFFGSNNGKVYKFDDDYNDDDAPIVGTMQTAFSDFGTLLNKRFTMARGLFLSPAGYAPQLTMMTDYDTNLTDLVTITAAGGATPWDAGLWDVSLWGYAVVPSRPWQTVYGVGAVGSLAFSVSVTSEVSFNKADIIFEPGGIL